MAIMLRRDGGESAIIPFYRPFGLFSEMDELACENWDAWRTFTTEQSLVPYTDVYEEDNKLIMKTELPGINQTDLDITLEGDRLTIQAEKREEVMEDATHHTRERHYGKYLRSFTLPYPVKESKIQAIFDNGVLELRLPKVEEIKAKKIEIKAEIPMHKPKKRQQIPRQKKS
ncbi:Hsp20/alpha crystallin family protein [Chloroflexota bacterium]